MSRTILYYPHIEVPTSGPWIRRALLYWNHVAAIVPRSYDDYMSARGLNWFRPELQDLYEQKIFRPINPAHLFRDERSSQGFHDDWRGIIEGQRYRPLASAVCDTPIYKDKVSGNIFHQLESLGLAVDTGNNLLYFFEAKVAAVYMALLAKHLAGVQREPTIPATNLRSLSDRIFGKGIGGNLARFCLRD
jgi:hypothetical protein